MRYKLYMADGSEFIATSVKRAKNNAGTGYRVEAEINGRVLPLFYKTEEITTILQLNGDGDYAPNFRRATNGKETK